MRLFFLILVLFGGYYAYQHGGLEVVRSYIASQDLPATKEELLLKKEEIQSQIAATQSEITAKVEAGEERVEDIRTSLEQLHSSLNAVLTALDELDQATSEVKGAFDFSSQAELVPAEISESPSPEATDEP